MAKRSRSSDDEYKVDLSKFRASTSAFRSEEERALNIDISHTDNLNNIFNSINMDDLDNNTNELVLEDWNMASILLYDPTNTKYELTVNQRRLIYNLKNVILNNKPGSTSPRCERYIDELVANILNYIGFNDCENLFLLPCQLQLVVNNQTFAAIADKECKKGDSITWFLQEDKHERSSTYKHGDLQLACAMIAGFQENYNLLERVYPDKMLGIKVVADRFYFCSMTATQEYLEELFDGLPESRIIMNVYPKCGLQLRNINERLQILKLLVKMKNEMLLST
jgi:hypothetical protein